MRKGSTDWFASFERIARANEWDSEKSGRMVSAFLRGPAGDNFEKIEEVNKTNFRVIKQSLIDRFSPADMRRSLYLHSFRYIFSILSTSNSLLLLV